MLIGNRLLTPLGRTIATSAALFALMIGSANAQGTTLDTIQGMDAMDVVQDTVAGAMDDRTHSLPEVLPLEDVITDGLPRIGEFAGTEGVLRFISAIPLACSVVYGETTAYGNLTLDTDMSGGAHSDHHPVLNGLLPDTLYNFRVQGTAADGRIFASQNMTFRTPPADTAQQSNLLSPESGARVTEVSSNFGGGSNSDAWGADSALDGKRSTAWSSNGDGDGAFLEIELANRSELSAVEVWTRSMSDGSAQITTFMITTDSGAQFGPFTLDNADESHRFDIDVTTSNLRLEVISSTGGNTGLVEIAAYGTPVSQ